MTTFAQIPIEKIHANPKNVRWTAVADDDMVASIRAQGILDPVMVAPHTTIDGEYELIDGHRRHDGAVKADLTVVPAYIREDLVTEAQQLEVMLITALHREGLSVAEESAAYEQLELFGMTADDIGAATGRPTSTIKARLKLGGLSDTAKSRLHDGQLTLGDAESLLEFADDQELLARLEKEIGGNNFRYELSRARDDRQRKAAREQHVREISAGISFEPLEYDGDYPTWDNETGPTSIEKTGFEEAASHVECGRMFWPKSMWQTPFLVCVDPGRHPKVEREVTPAEQARADREAEWEKQSAARAEERARELAAAKVRVDHLTGHFAGIFTTKTVTKPMLDSLRVTTLATLDSGEGFDTAAYVAVLGLDQADDWNTWWQDGDAHIASLRTATPKRFLAAYAALLAAQVEYFLEPSATDSVKAWEYLESTGYELSDVDKERRGEAEEAAA